MDAITPSEAVELYLQDKRADSAELTVRSHRSRLSFFLEWCEAEGLVNMNELTARRAHEYKVWRRNREDPDTGETPNTVTVKSAIDTFRVFTRFCESIDAVQDGLSEKIISPSISKNEDVRDEMLDAEVAQKILEHLEKYRYATRDHVTLLILYRCLLRRGALRAVDLDDISLQGDAHIELVHRPDQGTPLKNKQGGERHVAIRDATARVIQDFIEKNRHDITDEHGREPLLTTRQGRIHANTIQSTIYHVTRPCLVGDCPHDRDVKACAAAENRQKAHECPSSVSPHPVRRGGITHWLSEDVPKNVVSGRANADQDVLDRYYDQRDSQQRMEQRRDYMID